MSDTSKRVLRSSKYKCNDGAKRRSMRAAQDKLKCQHKLRFVFDISNVTKTQFMDALLLTPIEKPQKNVQVLQHSPVQGCVSKAGSKIYAANSLEKTKRGYRKKSIISSTYIGDQMVTRSTTKLFKLFPVKDCFVALKRNIQADALSWLSQPQKAKKIVHRRGTVAGDVVFPAKNQTMKIGVDFMREIPIDKRKKKKENDKLNKKTDSLCQYVDYAGQSKNISSGIENCGCTELKNNNCINFDPFRRLSNTSLALPRRLRSQSIAH